MTLPSLEILLTRLLWPIPQIRWEVARQLARLIRNCEKGTAEALLAWTASRTLESEALLGLGVIYGFKLGNHFDEDEVRSSLNKPSLLSDWMLRKLFGKHKQAYVFRYGVSPRSRAGLSEDETKRFDKFKTIAIPPVFQDRLQVLERQVEFGFVARWRHEWEWLQKSFGGDLPNSDFFIGNDPSVGAPLQMHISELFVSAFLRTLAYAVFVGKLESDEAEASSMLALPFNQGLCEVEPVECPTWCRNLIDRWKATKHELVEEVWTNATTYCCSGEEPVALTLVETNENHFIEISIELVARGGLQEHSEPNIPEARILVEGQPGIMSTDLVFNDSQIIATRNPVSLCCHIHPKTFGRLDTELACHVKLACPAFIQRDGKLGYENECMELKVEEDVVSRWQYWHVNWEPTRPLQLESTVSSMTTSTQSWIMRCAGSHVNIEPLVCVRFGSRSYTHSEYEVSADRFWLES